MVIETLPKSTIHLLKCSQVITSIGSIIKELVENSLDAGAKIITVKLSNYGFDGIDVKDNGSGISIDNAELVTKAHCTSKIKDFTDLESLEYYGFRGEALSSLCAVSNVSIISKAENEPLGYCFTYDNQGLLTSKKPTASPKG